MARTKTRIKAVATPEFVPQSQDSTADSIREIGELQRELTRMETQMNDQLAAVKEGWELRAAPLRQRVQTLTTGVQIFCDANRNRLTQGGKVKTAPFATGEVCWRTRPPSVRVTGQEAVLDALRRQGLDRFIRTKEEVNKDAILNEPASVISVPGISIQQGEDFVISPFETEFSERV